MRTYYWYIIEIFNDEQKRWVPAFWEHSGFGLGTYVQPCTYILPDAIKVVSCQPSVYTYRIRLQDSPTYSKNSIFFIKNNQHNRR